MIKTISKLHKVIIQPRQLIIRKNGEASLVNIACWTQSILFVFLLGLTAWITIASYSFFHQQTAIEGLELKNKIAATDRIIERASLKLQIAQQEQRLEQLSSHQKLLLAMVDNVPKSLGTPDNDPTKTPVSKPLTFGLNSDALERAQNTLISLLSSNIDERIHEIRAGLKKGGVSPNLDTFTAQGGLFHSVEEHNIPTSYLSTMDKLEELNALENLILRIPDTLPVKRKHYYISSHYGFRKDPFNGKRALHKGVDLVGRFKTKVLTPADGIVVKAGYNGGYGKFIEIKHDNDITTRYGHLHKINVKKGQAVTKSDVIGLMGNTGRSTSTHLHYEVLQNKKHINPIKLTRAVSRVSAIERIKERETLKAQILLQQQAQQKHRLNEKPHVKTHSDRTTHNIKHDIILEDKPTVSLFNNIYTYLNLESLKNNLVGYISYRFNNVVGALQSKLEEYDLLHNNQVSQAHHTFTDYIQGDDFKAATASIESLLALYEFAKFTLQSSPDTPPFDKNKYAHAEPYIIRKSAFINQENLAQSTHSTQWYNTNSLLVDTLLGTDFRITTKRFNDPKPDVTKAKRVRKTSVKKGRWLKKITVAA